MFYELPTIKKVLELSFGKLSDRARQRRRAWPKVLWEQVKSSEGRLSEKLFTVNTGHEECKWVNLQLLNLTSLLKLGNRVKSKQVVYYYSKLMVCGPCTLDCEWVLVRSMWVKKRANILALWQTCLNNMKKLVKWVYIQNHNIWHRLPHCQLHCWHQSLPKYKGFIYFHTAEPLLFTHSKKIFDTVHFI